MVNIRTADKADLDRILELGEKFGHLMLYQKDRALMEACLPRILVAEEVVRGSQLVTASRVSPLFQIVGYYHYIVSGDPGFLEMLQCYRQIPPDWLTVAENAHWTIRGKLCICMQGASHREVFSEFIEYFQARFPEVWCYPSTKSGRTSTYRQLGFDFKLTNGKRTFWNCNKGDYSTYSLGRWIRSIPKVTKKVRISEVLDEVLDFMTR